MNNPNNFDSELDFPIFEKIRTFINWKENCQALGIQKTKSKLMQKFTPQEIEKAENYGQYLVAQLEKAIEDWQNKNKTELELDSDDGLSDLLAHITSEGLESVQKYIQNPKILEERCQNGDYEENFLYCFPDKSDWQLLELEYYKKQIQEFLGKMEAKKLKPNPEQAKIMTEIENGIFKNYNYQELVKIFETLNVGHYRIPNLWQEGYDFYKK